MADEKSNFWKNAGRAALIYGLASGLLTVTFFVAEPHMVNFMTPHIQSEIEKSQPKGESYRGGFSKKTGVPVDEVVIESAKMYFTVKSLKAEVDSLRSHISEEKKYIMPHLRVYIKPNGLKVFKWFADDGDLYNVHKADDGTRWYVNKDGVWVRIFE